MRNMITFDHVSLNVTAGAAIRDVSMEIKPGEFICIVGSSGSGKTLLLEMLIGMKPPSSGKITVDGVDIHALPPALLRLYRREVGYLKQGDDQLLPEKSIAANIALALGAGRANHKEIAMRTSELLNDIGLPDKAACLPEALNREERKLVALAQALARGPKILLADDPFADMEPEKAGIIRAFLVSEHASGTTIILTTHNPKTVEDLKARFIRMEKGILINRGHEDRKSPSKTASSPVARHSIIPKKV